MVRRLLPALLLCLLFAAPAFATREKIQGWCEDGGTSVTIPGTAGSGTQRFQQTFRSCTVTVYLANTVTLATLYSDPDGTAQANPFTASALGRWSFFADGGNYDLRFSAGGISTPFTLGDFRIPNEVFNVTDYGALCDGTTNDYTAIDRARAAATAQTNGGTVLIPANVTGSCLINSSITFDADVTVQYEGGGRTSQAASTTMTINGSISAPPSHIFTGSGSAVFGTGSRVAAVYPQWWGAVGDASTASGPAFVSAVVAAGTNGTIVVPPGTYNVTFAGQTGDGLALRQGQTFSGYGAVFSNQAARSAAGFLRVVDATDVKIYGLEYDGNISVATPDANNGVSAIIANRADRLLIKDVYIHDPGLDSLYIEDSQDVVIDGVRVANSPRFGMTFASTLENADGLALANSSFTGDGYGDSASGGCIDIESVGFLTRYANITNFTCKPHANVFSAGIVLHDNGHNLTNVTVIMPSNVAKPAVNTQPDVSNLRISNSYFESSGDAIPTLSLEGDDITISNTKVLNTGDGTPANTYAIRGDSSTGATDVQINGGVIIGYAGNIVENLRTTAIWQLNNVNVIAGNSAMVAVQLSGPFNTVNGGYWEEARVLIGGKGGRVSGATFDGIDSASAAITIQSGGDNSVVANNVISRYANGIELDNGALYCYVGGNVVYNNDTDAIRVMGSTTTWTLVAPNIAIDDQAVPTQNRGVFINNNGTAVMAQIATGNVTSQVAMEQGMYSGLGFIPCSDSAGDAACGGASSGSFVIDVGDVDTVVSTSSIGANSQILIMEDYSLGTRLGVTCNTTTGRTYQVSARTNATSFRVTSSAAPGTNPACMSFLVIN